MKDINACPSLDITLNGISNPGFIVGDYVDCKILTGWIDAKVRSIEYINKTAIVEYMLCQSGPSSLNQVTWDELRKKPSPFEVEEKIKKDLESKFKYAKKIEQIIEVGYGTLIEEYFKYIESNITIPALIFEKWLTDIYCDYIKNYVLEKNIDNKKLGPIHFYKFTKIEVRNFNGGNFRFRVEAELLPQYDLDLISNEVKNYRHKN